MHSASQHIRNMVELKHSTWIMPLLWKNFLGDFHKFSVTDMRPALRSSEQNTFEDFVSDTHKRVFVCAIHSSTLLLSPLIMNSYMFTVCRQMFGSVPLFKICFSTF